MVKIKENELESVLQNFKNRNINIYIEGCVKQKLFLENVRIIFEESDSKFEFLDDKNSIQFDLGFVEEISLVQKNELKFLIENQLEILIALE